MENRITSKKRITTKDMIMCGLFTALIAVGAFIRIPIPVVPFTLQFLFTMLAGLIMGGRLGAISVLIYIALGLIGIPVFAEGGGIWYVLKPSFGYIVGFAAASYVTGRMVERGRLTIGRILAANFTGLAIVYAAGMIYYYIICNFVIDTPIAFWPLFLYCFLLAVPGDIVLCFLAAIMAKRIRPVYQSMNTAPGAALASVTPAMAVTADGAGTFEGFEAHGPGGEIDVQALKERVIQGGEVTRDEALKLFEAPLDELTEAADEIRNAFCGNDFDICTIINGKSGKCSENCKYCAQSAHYDTGDTEVYGLLSTEELLKEAKYNDEHGVLRYSIVTSGRRLPDEDVDRLCESIRRIKEETNIEVCVSCGLLGEEQFRKLREAGASRAHCNLESSREYFPQVCTTHTYDEKISTLKAAERAGLGVCSGGIMGLGESVADRIDMAFTIRRLGVKSVPVNFLNPIKGTPYENNVPLTDEEARRCVAVYRFIMPDASIRLAGGRGLLEDKGRACFTSGANAAISGDMLTTAGITVDRDMKMLDELGYEARLCNG